jgi:hypothetical protein
MKKSYMFVSLMLAAIMLLTACGTAATPTANCDAHSRPDTGSPRLYTTSRCSEGSRW